MFELSAYRKRKIKKPKWKQRFNLGWKLASAMLCVRSKRNFIVPSTIKCLTSTCPKHTFLILITKLSDILFCYYAQNCVIIPLALLQKFRINVILACCTFILALLHPAFLYALSGIDWLNFHYWVCFLQKASIYICVHFHDMLSLLHLHRERNEASWNIRSPKSESGWFSTLTWPQKSGWPTGRLWLTLTPSPKKRQNTSLTWSQTWTCQSGKLFQVSDLFRSNPKHQNSFRSKLDPVHPLRSDWLLLNSNIIWLERPWTAVFVTVLCVRLQL